MPAAVLIYHSKLVRVGDIEVIKKKNQSRKLNEILPTIKKKSSNILFRAEFILFKCLNWKWSTLCDKKFLVLIRNSSEPVFGGNIPWTTPDLFSLSFDGPNVLKWTIMFV